MPGIMLGILVARGNSNALLWPQEAYIFPKARGGNCILLLDMVQKNQES